MCSYIQLGITDYLLFHNNIYRYNKKKGRKNEHDRINNDIDVIADLTITLIVTLSTGFDK